MSNNALPENWNEKMNISKVALDYFKVKAREINFDKNGNWKLRCYESDNDYYTNDISISFGIFDGVVKGVFFKQNSCHINFGFQKLYDGLNGTCSFALIINDEVKLLQEEKEQEYALLFTLKNDVKYKDSSRDVGDNFTNMMSFIRNNQNENKLH